MNSPALQSQASTFRWPLVFAVLVSALGFSALAFAQMGDVGMAMGAAGVMANNPISQGAQQTQQAAALAAGQQPAPAPAAVPATPAAPAAGTAAPAAATSTATAPVVPAPAEPVIADLNSPFRQSLFFSPQDIIAIKKASETPPNVKMTQDGKIETPVIPMNRFITVSGITYKSRDNWVVWINGQKVVPGYIPLKELVELGVAKDYVRIKWFDIGLNGVINLTMRPNQTYYIVPGLLLPGVAQQ